MSRLKRTALFGFAFLLSGALVLSACSSSADNTPTAANTTAVTVANLPTAALSPTGTAAAAQPTGSPTAAAQPAAASTETPASPADTPAAEPTATAAQPGGAVEGVPTDTVTALPDPAGYEWAQVAAGFTRPVDVADTGDGTGRLLVLEQAGVIRAIQNGSLLPDPFLDIRDRVGTSGNERGLLGIALHPKFPETPYFYVNYTDKNGNTSISRFSVSASDANRADPASEKVLLQVDQPYANHNGGVLTFGPDGFLYAGLGDGGSAGDPQGHGQALDTLLGKILRIDVDGGDPYAVPADNPFAGGGGKPEIWAYGLRNPWRFSFDRLTHDLYIADVGQGNWEEIDFQPVASKGGENYGWNYREGTHAFKGTPPGDLPLVDPVFEYSHADGCSVTGGFVYRGQSLPAFRGVYLFADYCSGKMWGLLRGADGGWQSQELFQTGMSITSFGQDKAGELYLTDQGSGAVYKLQGK